MTDSEERDAGELAARYWHPARILSSRPSIKRKKLPRVSRNRTRARFPFVRTLERSKITCYFSSIYLLTIKKNYKLFLFIFVAYQFTLNRHQTILKRKVHWWHRKNLAMEVLEKNYYFNLSRIKFIAPNRHKLRHLSFALVDFQMA